MKINKNKIIFSFASSVKKIGVSIRLGDFGICANTHKKLYNHVTSNAILKLIVKLRYLMKYVALLNFETTDCSRYKICIISLFL